MLGDLVRLDGRLKVVIRPENSDFRVRDIKTGLATLCTIDSVVPIKLTPRILKANGWEKLDNVYKIPTYGHQEAEWLEVMFELDDCKAFCLDCAIVDSFNYVHELQHLLFGLGLPSDLKV